MQCLKNKIILFFLTFFIFLLINTAVNAQALNFKEAVTIGLENNKELTELREEIKSLKRDLRLNQAYRGWQFKLEADINHSFETEDESSNSGDVINQNNKNAALNITRTFSKGLQFHPQIKISEEDLSPDLSLELAYPLYPLTPTSLEKKYFSLQKELLKNEEKWENLGSEKLKSWLEGYLNLIRLKERREAYRNSLKQSQNNFKIVQQQKEIGEAGKQELLIAQLSVKEAEYKLQDLKFQLQEQKSILENQLGLSKAKIKIEKSSFIENLESEVETLSTKYCKHQNLMKLVVGNSYELKINEINREILKKELEWLKKEGGGRVNLKGSYNSDREEFLVGINLSYSLYDGGQQEMNLEAKTAKIEISKRNYQEIYRTLKNKLQQYENGIKLGKIKIKKEKINLEKANHQVEVSRQQQKQGLIDYLEYQKAKIDQSEAEVNYHSVLDQLFLSRLELVNFIDRKVWLKGFPDIRYNQK